MQKSLKILVGYHKPANLIKNDILVPIHLGRALTTQASKDGELSQEDYQWLLDNMIGDDTGDNISHLNRYFCELTAIYWAWKNYDKLGNPDYIGFCHYRRFLDFSEKYTPDINNCLAVKNQNVISPETIDFYENHADEIIQQVSKTDIIHGALIKHTMTVHEHFKTLERPEIGLRLSIFDYLLNLAAQKYPEYSKAIKTYSNSKFHYWFNCFVMKKEIFFEYCDFIFSILLGYEKKIDYTMLNLNGQRILAYIGERLLGCYLTKKQMEGKKIKFNQLIFIKNPDIVKEIKPAFTKNNIPVVLSSDDKYVPYLTVCLHSIIQNTTNHNYDICILENGMSRENKQKLKRMETSNVSIRFVSVSLLMNSINTAFPVFGHFSLATYYRFFIPELFKHYDKVLYLDCDTIIQSDVADLYNTDLQDKYIAAVQDVEIFRACYNEYYYNTNWKQYLTKTLKMENPSGYFQAGVIIFNIQKLNAFNFRAKCIKSLSSIKPIYVDQCIMNHVLQGHVLYLPYEWNVLPLHSNIEQELPLDIYNKYNASLQNPKIVHYVGKDKPWHQPTLLLAEIWWKYARMTPFYEQFLFNRPLPPVIAPVISKLSKNEYRHKYQFHRFMSHITFGKMHKKHQKSARHYKKIIKTM